MCEKYNNKKKHINGISVAISNAILGNKYFFNSKSWDGFRRQVESVRLSWKNDFSLLITNCTVFFFISVSFSFFLSFFFLSSLTLHLAVQVRLRSATLFLLLFYLFSCVLTTFYFVFFFLQLIFCLI